MNVLDIDLDFFLDPRPQCIASEDRLSSDEFTPWRAEDVEEYLVKKCRLSREHPIPGSVVTCHHELFDIWNSLIASGTLQEPFEVTHIDSHADMGMGFGDCSIRYVFTELLRHDLSIRECPPRDGTGKLCEGNYLLFAIACRWLSSLVYVHHPDLLDQNHGRLPDIPDSCFRDCNPKSPSLQLKLLPAEYGNGLRKARELTPLSLEPEVPFQLIEGSEFLATTPFDFVFLAQSPRYTPASADPLMDVFRKFITPLP